MSELQRHYELSLAIDRPPANALPALARRQCWVWQTGHHRPVLPQRLDMAVVWSDLPALIGTHQSPLLVTRRPRAVAQISPRAGSSKKANFSFGWVAQTSASKGCWTTAVPPRDLIACNPAGPSFSIPLRMTPIAREPYDNAAERNKGSMEGRCHVLAGPDTEADRAVDQKQMAIGHRDIDPARFDRLAIDRLSHGQGCTDSQNVGIDAETL